VLNLSFAARDPNRTMLLKKAAADLPAAAMSHWECQSCDMPPSMASSDPVMKEESSSAAWRFLRRR
jgi:hypothetical protein